MKKLVLFFSDIRPIADEHAKAKELEEHVDYFIISSDDYLPEDAKTNSNWDKKTLDCIQKRISEIISCVLMVIWETNGTTPQQNKYILEEIKKRKIPLIICCENEKLPKETIIEFAACGELFASLEQIMSHSLLGIRPRILRDLFFKSKVYFS